jgi:hypothetical protein
METLIFACAENFVRIDLRPPFARNRDRLPAWTRRTLRSRQRKYDLERGPKGQHSQKSACGAVLLALRAVTACNGSDLRGARTHRRTSREFRISIEEGVMW